MKELVELQSVRQDPDGPKRRWFRASGTDLIVWLDEHELPYGFQLCYERGAREFALTWTNERGFDHSAVDSGEGDPMKNRAPVLVADGVFEQRALLEQFEASSSQIPEPIRKLVIDALTLYPNDPIAPGKKPAVKPRRSEYWFSPLFTWVTWVKYPMSNLSRIRYAVNFTVLAGGITIVALFFIPEQAAFTFLFYYYCAGLFIVGYLVAPLLNRVFPLEREGVGAAHRAERKRAAAAHRAERRRSKS